MGAVECVSKMATLRAAPLTFQALFVSLFVNTFLCGELLSLIFVYENAIILGCGFYCSGEENTGHYVEVTEGGGLVI